MEPVDSLGADVAESSDDNVISSKKVVAVLRLQDPKEGIWVFNDQCT